MDSVLTSIIDGIKEIFPETEDRIFSPESLLGDLPEWDSMAAVNLQSYLQQQFDIEVPIELLTDETIFEELVAFIKNPSFLESA